MKVLAIFPKWDDSLNFSSPWNGMIAAFEVLAIPLHVMMGLDVIGQDMTKVRSSSTEHHIIDRIAELQPDMVISINNHGMTKAVRDYITVPVVRWLFDDVEHYFVHESFGSWQNSFDAEDLVVCYNSELRQKVEDSCPYLRRKPVFLPHATSIDLFSTIPSAPKHNISFIGSYLDVGPVVHLMQNFGAKGSKAPLAIEEITKELMLDHQLDVRAALVRHDLADSIGQINMRPDDFKRILSDLITTRDRLEAVVSLRQLGVAVFGKNDWVIPLILLRDAEKLFQYDSKLNTQVELLTAYQSSLITIDIPNVQNRTAIGGRVIEAMASNSLLITKFQEDSDLYRIFGSDCPVLTYRDLPHLYELCKYYLDHPDKRMELVARCNLLVAKGFDYKDRIKTVLGMADLQAPSVRLRIQATIERLPADVVPDVYPNGARHVTNDTAHTTLHHAALRAIASAAIETHNEEAATRVYPRRAFAGLRRRALGLLSGLGSEKSGRRALLRAVKKLPTEDRHIYQIISQHSVGLEFDGDTYLARNPDVAREGCDPLLHFVKHGRHEGREPAFSLRT